MLAIIQQQLEEIYALDIGHDVHDYLVTSAELEQQSYCFLPQRNNCRERLFLLQDKEDIHLSLYLHEAVIKKLDGTGKASPLPVEHLEEFCLALEGISHFIYVIWNASYNRRINLVEMELQAEIDKFIVLWRYLRQYQGEGGLGTRLLRLLFQTCSFSSELSKEELQRYRDASLFAGQYCLHLDNSYGSRGRDMLTELRRFYRLGPGDKLRRINSFY